MLSLETGQLYLHDCAPLDALHRPEVKRTVPEAHPSNELVNAAWSLKSGAAAESAGASSPPEGRTGSLAPLADISECKRFQSSAGDQRHSSAGQTHSRRLPLQNRFVEVMCILQVQVANFTAILDKDLSDRRRTAEMDIQPLLTDSYTGRIKVRLLAVLCMLCKL